MIRSSFASHSARLACWFAAAFCIMTAFAAPAHAVKCRFGTEDHITHLRDTNLTSSDGNALYLGYRFTYRYLCLPYAMIDEGYVLGVKDQQRYHPLTATEIAGLQQQGSLPSPLPPNQHGVFDYVFGFFLWFVGLAVALWIWIAGRREKRQKQALPNLQAGVDLLNHGQFAAAADELTKAAKLAPKVPAILLYRGHAYANMNETDKALADYTAAVRMQPDYVDALVSRAGLSLKRGNQQGAIIDFDKVVDVTKAEMAYALRGDAYAKIGDFEAALKDFGCAIEVNPITVGARRMRAQVYRAINREDLAQADEAKANELSAAPPAAGP